jgi:hypothetical protein
MSKLTPINQVLQATDQLLNLPQASVDDEKVWRELKWPDGRKGEVCHLMARLIEDGDLRGSQLRGDNQPLSVTASGTTPQGRERLTLATRPWWRRTQPVMLTMGGILTTVAAGLILHILTGR